MANQDMLFPILPRNTQVDVRDKNLRVTRTANSRSGKQVKSNDSDNLTQEARVRQKYQLILDSDESETERKQSLPYAAPQGAASDPRRKTDDDDDSNKGVNLDTYA